MGVRHQHRTVVEGADGILPSDFTFDDLRPTPRERMPCDGAGPSSESLVRDEVLKEAAGREEEGRWGNNLDITRQVL